MKFYSSDSLSAASRHLLKKHAISTESGIIEAMKKINHLSGETMTLFAFDENGVLRGTVTDGDIRRALVNGNTLDARVSEVMHRKFLYAVPGEDMSAVLARGRKLRIDLLPVMDGERLIDIMDIRKVKAMLPIEAVLMAGGRGERLRPLTDTMPKPLLPVGDKPIIDYNVEELESCGIRRIYVTVNYLADMIEDHFSRREGMAKVSCVREPRRLGTLGSLALIGDIATENILVMNSDLLMDIDFEAMYLQHSRNKADITIAAVPYNVSVPFAIMRMKNGEVTSLEEKPTFNYFANGGVYMMKTSLLERIEKDKYLDAPDFITSVIGNGGKVGCHHLEGSWIDIGSPDDYRLACELMSRRNHQK